MWYIIYPNGNKSKIDIVELSLSEQYELSDYAVASRRELD